MRGERTRKRPFYLCRSVHLHTCSATAASGLVLGGEQPPLGPFSGGPNSGIAGTRELLIQDLDGLARAGCRVRREHSRDLPDRVDLACRDCD
jgi:hypothetical protein